MGKENEINKNSSKVTIVLPTHNGAQYLRESMDSCLNQTYKNIELIIVNDGSTDETLKIIKSYKDKRIKYIKCKKNQGLPKALNLGFSKATGEYLTWTSDDNLYHETAIEKMLSFLKDKKCSFVYCDYYRFNNENLSSCNIFKLPNLDPLKNEDLIGPCFLYSRNVKEIIGEYDPEKELVEDYDFWLRVSKRFSMCHLGEPLYFYRIHNKSLSSLRYDEIRIADFLVKLKNNASNINQVNELIRDYIAQIRDYTAQKMVKLFKLNNIRGVRYLLFIFSRILFDIFLSKEIKKVLKDYNDKKINFKEVKLKLYNMRKYFDYG
jgi:glycosyltransferase involved in cell wall biosynthesis